jgi:hypothetical protein
MEFLLIPLAVLIIGIVVIPMLLRRNRAASQDDLTQRGSGIPGPGGPTPVRKGRPMPGSRPDRSAHGKP